MTALATATHAAINVATRARSGFQWFAAAIAEARIHKARLEAEVHHDRIRLATKTDDDLPVII